MPQDFPFPATVNFEPIERMLVAFYARKFQRSKSEVVRVMIRGYARADQGLNTNEFRDFVNKEFLSTECKEGEESEAYLAAASEFIAKVREKLEITQL